MASVNFEFYRRNSEGFKTVDVTLHVKYRVDDKTKWGTFEGEIRNEDGMWTMFGGMTQWGFLQFVDHMDKFFFGHTKMHETIRKFLIEIGCKL